MAEYLKFVLDDGSAVLFESASTALVTQHGGGPDIVDGGRLAARLEALAQAAGQVARSLRARVEPDEVSLTFGIKVSAELNAWFVAKSQAEGAIGVTLSWHRPDSGTPDE